MNYKDDEMLRFEERVERTKRRVRGTSDNDP